MNQALDLLLVFVLLMNFLMLGSSWLRVMIRIAAFQGVLLAFMPLFIHHDGSGRVAALALGTAAVKGALIPSLLLRAMRDASIRRETNPYIGFVPSLALGALGTTAAVLFARLLPLSPEHTGTLLVPASLATFLTGFILLTTRRKAVMQVVGYLILENGIFIFGLLLLDAMPFFIEIGVLLDLFVAIFIMGIVLNHIKREFSSFDTEHLADLRE
ncbi:MAG: hydrogenase [Candidatus Hydrogenedentota bacterium]